MTKRILCSILLILIASGMHQTVAQDATIGFTAEVSFNNQRLINQNSEALTVNFNTRPRVDWQVGVLSKVPLTAILGIRPAFKIGKKGYRYKDDNAFLTVTVTSKPLYLNLEVPMTISATFLSQDFFIGLGPYIGYGIGGKIDTNGAIAGFGFLDDGAINWGSDNNDDYKPGDIGITFTGGMDLDERISISLTYNLGMSNIAPTNENGGIIRNRSLALGINYFL